MQSCTDEAGELLRTAVTVSEEGNLDRADTILSHALDRCPDNPQVLGGLAGLRVRQGHLAEAEALATRLVRIHPEAHYGWELLAAIRYLRDDPQGALRAWSRGRAPRVGEVDIRIHGPDGRRASNGGPDPIRVAGAALGRPLTFEGLVRGSRRLEALPAAARARLGYRALGGGQAAIEGAVVLQGRHPFTAPDLAAHVLRGVAGRVQLVFADPLGRLERWELAGTVEGKIRRVALTLDHAAPAGHGVWRWELDHGVGSYAAHAGVVREERTSVGWSHADWVTASLRGTVHGRIDVRPGRGTFAGAGVGWTLLPLTARSSVGVEGKGWAKVGGGAAGGAGSEEETRFGHLEVRAALHPQASAAVGAPSGVAAHVGVVAVSSQLPPDLIPRIGAGGSSTLLMRARSDLDGEGVVRPLFPGRAWAHGGVELLHPVRSVGLAGIGVAVFADGVRVLASDGRSIDPAARRGAVHVGAGMRARIPGIDGWLRVDWGIDPADGASTVSAAWFRGHRLDGLALR